MSGQKLAILVGASVGTLVCILMLVLGIIYLKYRRKKTLNDKARQSPTLGHLTGTHRSQGWYFVVDVCNCVFRELTTVFNDYICTCNSQQYKTNRRNARI